MKGIFKRQSGQAMIEFALVLPILIILSVGTIFLTITYIHQSTMNGVSFMSARALAVRENTKIAQDVNNQFKQRAKFNNPQHWLNTVNIKAQKIGDTAEVTLSKSAEQLDMLANFIDSVGNGNTHHDPRIQTAKIVLSDEYIERNGSSRPQTSSMVTYRYSLMGGDAWDKLLPDLIKERLPIDLSQIAMIPKNQQEKDAVLGTLPYQKRFQSGLEPRLKKFYETTGISGGDGLNNSEDVSGTSSGLLAVSNFNRMKKIHSQFKVIQTGAGAMNLFLEALLMEIPGGKAIIDKIGREVARIAETAMNQIESSVETHKEQTFSQEIL